MRRVLLAVVAVFSIAFAANNADAGLFGRHHGGGCCEAAPACGCDVAPAYAPSCGCEVAPAYGCCEAAPACGCGKKHGRLHGLFGKHHNRGNSCCEAAPACGCEVAPVYAPSCGCEVAPAYGCCEAAPACGCGHKHGRRHGRGHGLFGKHHNRGNSCCEAAPACGCESAPSCGCGL